MLRSQGATASDADRQISVTELIYYRWRKEYGGMKAKQLRRLKELEKENERQALGSLSVAHAARSARIDRRIADHRPDRQTRCG